MNGWLRKHIATDGLRASIKGSFGLDVDIVYADGSEQTEAAQVLYDTEKIDPESADLISVKGTFITFVKADLDQEIVNGDEKIYFKIPKSPSNPDIKIGGMLDGSKSVIDGESVGFIKIPLTDVEQS